MLLRRCLVASSDFKLAEQRGSAKKPNQLITTFFPEIQWNKHSYTYNHNQQQTIVEIVKQVFKNRRRIA